MIHSIVLKVLCVNQAETLCRTPDFFPLTLISAFEIVYEVEIKALLSSTC